MYIVSSNPHIHSKNTVSNIMKDVLIALTPATLAGIYFFGLNALLVIIVSITSCVLSELVFEKIVHKQITIKDYSAAVTGMLLAFCLPATTPLWVVAIGGIFAIVIVKQLFGGIGQNFVNPALAARAFLLASYPAQMSNWVNTTSPSDFSNWFHLGTVDSLTSATPLTVLKEGTLTITAQDYINAFIGNIGGCIGEISAIALIIGFVYLIVKKVISIRIPLVYILTVFILSMFLNRQGSSPLYELLTGGLLLGAFFMATDYTTSPMTPLGQIIMGLGCGILTVVIRFFGGYPEGVSYSILIMNLAVPLIDRFTKPKVYGEVKQ